MGSDTRTLYLFWSLSVLCAIIVDFCLFVTIKNWINDIRFRNNNVFRCFAMCVSCYAIYLNLVAMLYTYQAVLAAIGSDTYHIGFCIFEAMIICFFMGGKLTMYVYFTLRIHISFAKSKYEVPKKHLIAMTVVFFGIMAIIGGFYMIFFLLDLLRLSNVSDPTTCSVSLEVSDATAAIIFTGASCDSIWCIVCWLLFVRQLIKLINRTKSKNHKFFDLIFRMTVLSFYCAVSTLVLGMTVWVNYPTLCGVLDSAVNAVCVTMGFDFAHEWFNKCCKCVSIETIYCLLSPWLKNHSGLHQSKITITDSQLGSSRTGSQTTGAAISTNTLPEPPSANLTEIPRQVEASTTNDIQIFSTGTALKTSPENSVNLQVNTPVAPAEIENSLNIPKSHERQITELDSADLE